MFLGVLGIGLAAWSAIFIVDYATLRKNIGYEKNWFAIPSIIV